MKIQTDTYWFISHASSKSVNRHCMGNCINMHGSQHVSYIMHSNYKIQNEEEDAGCSIMIDTFESQS